MLVLFQIYFSHSVGYVFVLLVPLLCKGFFKFNLVLYICLCLYIHYYRRQIKGKKKILLQFLSKSVLLIGSYHTFSSLIHLSVFLCMVLESVQFSSVHLLSSVQLFVTPWTAAFQAYMSLSISHSLPKFTSTASVMPSSHLILWCPLLLLPSILPSIREFSNESAVHIRWPKYWRFSVRVDFV